MAGEGVKACDAQISVSIDAQGRSVRGIVAYQQKAGCASRGEPSNTSAALESTEANAAETVHAPAAAQAERSRSACGHSAGRKSRGQNYGQEFTAEINSPAAHRQLNN